MHFADDLMLIARWVHAGISTTNHGNMREDDQDIALRPVGEESKVRDEAVTETVDGTMFGGGMQVNLQWVKSSGV